MRSDARTLLAGAALVGAVIGTLWPISTPIPVAAILPFFAGLTAAAHIVISRVEP